MNQFITTPTQLYTLTKLNQKFGKKNKTKQNKKQLNKQIKNPSKGMLDEATVPTADSKKTMRSKCVQQKLEGGDEEQTGC